MKSAYRFLQVKDGHCYFALIELDLTIGSNSLTIIDALAQQVNRAEGEVSSASHPEWVRAALSGIRDTLEEAQRAGALPTGCEVELRRLVGTDVDTRADVVRCAAGLATAQGISSPAFQVDAVLAQGDLVFTGTVRGTRHDLVPLRWTYQARIGTQEPSQGTAIAPGHTE